MQNFIKKLQGTLKSFTIWFNLIIGTITVTLMEFIPYAHGLFPELQPYLTAESYKRLALVLIVGNIILRFKTKKSLAEK